MQDLAGGLDAVEPHAYMLELNTRCLACLIGRCNSGIAVIGGEGPQRYQVENGFGAAIAARDYVTNVLCMAEGFGRKLGEEDSKLLVGWHVLHIHDHRVKIADLWIALDHRYQRRCIGEKRPDA